jgi:ribosomal protein S18 acetylase RimI-like enzyme
MEIIELNQSQLSELESFKSLVWPLADKEHYGENQPKFYKKEFTLVAKQDNEIVGYVSVVADTGVAQIEPLMVKIELKGKGIGTKLLETAERKAKSLGVHKVWIETGSDWLAKGFYEKHGYQVRTTLPNHTGGHEFVLMDKML